MLGALQQRSFPGPHMQALGDISVSNCSWGSESSRAQWASGTHIEVSYWKKGQLGSGTFSQWVWMASQFSSRGFCRSSEIRGLILLQSLFCGQSWRTLELEFNRFKKRKPSMVR